VKDKLTAEEGLFNPWRLSTKREKGRLKSFYGGTTALALLFPARCGELQRQHAGERE